MRSNPAEITCANSRLKSSPFVWMLPIVHRSGESRRRHMHQNACGSGRFCRSTADANAENDVRGLRTHIAQRALGRGLQPIGNRGSTFQIGFRVRLFVRDEPSMGIYTSPRHHLN
jgi:hypothetical protein